MLATSSNSGAATPRPVAQTPGGAGAAATPATAPRGSDDGAGPLRIPFHVEKKGESTKAPGRADGTRGKGKGVVNAKTEATLVWFPDGFIAFSFSRWRRSSPGIHSASTPKLFIFRTKVD